MPLVLDTSRALRTHAELVGLVDAIARAPGAEPETDAVEWKRGLDLGSGWEHRFAAAKQVLGFGNRLPLAAVTTFEGCAYLVLGVEPQSVSGCDVWDPADIDGWIGRYVGPGAPRWTPGYVKYQGADVLVITVEAPRPGDPIHTLQRTYESFAAGRIFVRRHGKTTEAGPADLRQLEARLLGGETEVELDVGIVGEPPILKRVTFDQQAMEAWVRDEADRLWTPVAPRPKPKLGPSEFAPPEISHIIIDPRPRDEYVAECRAYVEAAPRRWIALAKREAIRFGHGRLVLKAHNPTRGNWERVQIVLDVPQGLVVYGDEDGPLHDPEVPEAPAEYGHGLAVMPFYARDAEEQLTQVERSGDRTVVGFVPFHLRPGATVKLDPVYLFADASVARSDIEIGWRATSTSAHGWAEGRFPLHVSEDPVVLTAPLDADE